MTPNPRLTLAGRGGVVYILVAVRSAVYVVRCLGHSSDGHDRT